MLSDTDALAKVTYDIGVDPIVIGYMADAFTRAQSSNNFIERRIPDGLQLALNELNKRSDTFPFPNRKMIVLMCGETDEPGTEPGASAAAIATHLAEVGVKAVVGPTNEPKSEVVARAISAASADAQYPIVSSWLSGQSGVQYIAGKLFTPAPQRSDLAGNGLSNPLQAGLKIIEDKLKKSSPADISVTVILDTQDASGLWGQYEQLLSGLEFNGRNSSKNQSDFNLYHVYKTGDAAYLDPLTGSSKLASDIRKDKPDVIIPLAGVTIINKLPGLIERGYGATDKKPQWLVPSILNEFPAFGSPGTYATSATDIDDDTRARISGVRVYRGSANYESMATVALAAFAGGATKTADPTSGARTAPVAPFESEARGYEDLYLLYYAAYKAAIDASAAGKKDFTPNDLIGALPAVTQEGAVSIGSVELALDKGLTELKQSGAVKLYGLLSTFSFNNDGTAAPQWERWTLSTVKSSVTGSYPLISAGCFVNPTPGQVGSFSDAKCAEFRGQQL